MPVARQTGEVRIRRVPVRHAVLALVPVSENWGLEFLENFAE